MDFAKKKSQNFTAAENAVLVEEVDCRKEILFSKFNSINSNDLKRKAWDEIASKVNAVNPGLDRCAAQVKKKWQDFQSRTKKKEAERRRDMTRTGGGPETITPLSELEGKVVSLLGETAIAGIFGGEDTMCPPTEVPVETMIMTEPDTADVPIPEASATCDRRDKVRKSGPPPSSYEGEVVEIEKRRLEVEEARLTLERERGETERQRLEVERERLELERQRLALDNSRSIFPVPVFVENSEG